MPLSEEELKILREIEAQLNATDPALAEQVANTTVYRHAGRNLKLALVGVAVGLAIVLTQFTTSTVVAAVGFLVMVGAAFVAVDNLKKLGKASLADLLGGGRIGVPRPAALDAPRDRLRRPDRDDPEF